MISRQFLLSNYLLSLTLQMCVLVVCALCLPENTYAISGGVIELPISSSGKIVYSKQSDLDLRVDTTWAGVHGYRPVTCIVSARSPQAADRQILIRFLAGNFRSEQPAVVVEKEFELSAGELSATTRFLVPQYVEWRGVGCETFVDGIKDDQLSLPQFPFPTSQAGHNFAAMLYDDADRVPWRMFRNIRGGPAEVLDSPTGELLETWMEYSSIDVVVTTLADLKIDHARTPDRFPELLKWVRAGGNLWVCAAGAHYQHVPEIEQYLDLSSAEDGTATDPAALVSRGWRFPQVDNPTNDQLFQYNQLYGSVDPATIAPEEPDNETDKQDSSGIPTDETSQQWFAVRPVGMGTVTVFAMDNPDLSRGEAQELAWAITQSLLTDRLSWDLRHGSDPDQGNDNFNDFLIPDVGAAPVTAFQVLLSLFVLGIGPVNYFVLKGREKLPLLLLTVPVAAAITTVLLLIYGFTSEGLGTMVRARSFTLLDQQAGSAVCWSRLSYFAGMTPSEGLVFPRDTLVYPILPSLRMGDHREMRRFANQRRELHWLGAQHLVDGWLASRTPVQYLTITSRDTARGIEFDVHDDSITATNRLEVDIQTLVVEAYDGHVYLGEKLAAGDTCELRSVDQVKAMATLRSLFSENEPQFPTGTLESLSLGGGIDLLPFSRNLMETQISALTSAATKDWGPGTYIAVTTEGADLSLGIDEISENSSFHVVKGIW